MKTRKKKDIFGGMNVARLRGERLGCNVAFSFAHRLQFDAGQDPLKLCRRDEDMLAIGAAHGALETTAFESFHPDRDAIGIPVQKLNTIAALIEEHEQAAIAHIALKVILDDAVETIEALPHIDGLAVQVDGDRRAESEHGDYATCSRISEMEPIALKGTRRVTPLGSLISIAVDGASVVWTLRKATLLLLSASLRFQ